MKNNPRNQLNITILLKSLGLLFLIVVICALFSRYLYGSGKTLQQYADSHPQDTDTRAQENNAQAPVNDSQMQDHDNDSVINSSENPSENDSAEEGNELTVPSESSADPPADTVLLPGTLPEENPLCTVYKEGFYYEPLGEDVKNYITGVSYPAEGAEEVSYEDLNYVHVLHYDFDGEIAHGELICNQAIAGDLVEIFYELYVAEYRIDKITLIEAYDGDDNASMIDNNTSCFNYRPVTGQSNLSRHALGLAIDINPFYNPYIYYPKEGGQIVLPEGSEAYTDRSTAFPYKIDTEDLCYRLFIEHGFTWGGNWNSMKDYQHFQKAIE